MILLGVGRLEIPNTSKFLPVCYRIYSVIIQIFYATFVINLSVELFILFKTDIPTALENMSRFIFVILLIVKVGMCQTEKVVELLRRSQLEEDEIICQKDYQISKVYKMHALYGFKVNLTLSVTAVSSAVTLCILGIQASYQFSREHVNTNDTSETIDKPQLLPLWYPIIDKNKRHMLVMSHQIVQTLLTSLFSSLVQTFTNSLLIFLRARLQILQIRFANFNSMQVGETSNHGDNIPPMTLKQLCVNHQQLISSIKELNDSLKGILLLECSVTSILLAALLTQILWRRYLAFNVVYFLLVVLQIMALSYNSNEIVVQSSQLSNALYESNWYTHGRKLQSLLLVMMMRCQKPLVLTVGPLGPMTTQVGVSVSKSKIESNISQIEIDSNDRRIHIATQIANPLIVSGGVLILRLMNMTLIGQFLPNIFQRINNIQDIMCIKDINEKDYTHMKIIITLMVTISVPFQIYYLIAIIPNNWISLVMFGFNFYNSFSATCLEFQFTHVCLILRNRFKLINSCMNRFKNEKYALKSSRLREDELFIIQTVNRDRYISKIIDMRTCHQKLSECCRDLNKLFGAQLLITLCCCGVSALLNFYFAIFGGFGQTSLIAAAHQESRTWADVFWALYFLLRFLDVCGAAEFLCRETDRTKSIISELLHECRNNRVKEEAS
ncbi:uncharacterized protein LOC132700939 [Cylas formicarius]|uniref:uncharacterized protein LOC132700939 n=1 Tax=Cylas formicarius TaxID=197179 RepID=UPI002958D55C|nr:uncharacterized protein LOC132700939 [Cylas formicarius]